MRTRARRAASICRADTQPGSRACRPYSPKVTSEPRRDIPLMRPRCCLRYLTRFGINMVATSLFHQGFHLAGFLLTDVHTLGGLGFLFHFGQYFTLINPHLDANLAVLGESAGPGEIHIRAQSLQRYSAFAQPNRASHFGAA